MIVFLLSSFYIIILDVLSFFNVKFNNLFFYIKLFSILYLIKYTVYLNFNKNFTFKKLIKLFKHSLFFLPFVAVGPFFIPPADPLAHAYTFWHSLENNELNEKLNITIFNIIYLLIRPSSIFENYIIIYIYHLFISYVLVISSFISAMIIGISMKLAVISTLIMLLFFGTNVFNYVTYYSLSPSALNMAIFWILYSLITKYIVSKQLYSKKELITLFTYFLLIPTLYKNHAQEAGFLFFSFFLYIIMKTYRLQLIYFNEKIFLFYKLMILFLYFLPIPIILEVINKFYLEIINDYYSKNHIIYLERFFILGNIYGPRILDTLGVMGIIPLIGCLFYISKKFSSKFYNKSLELKCIILGLLPFFVLFTPILITIWLIPLPYQGDVFWRITYSSMYWIFNSIFLYKLLLKIRWFLIKKYFIIA